MTRSIFAKSAWVVLVCAAFAVAPAPAHASDPMGVWARGDGIAKVKVAPCGENICATNTWIKPGTKSEKEGDVLVMSIKEEGSGAYKGSAFDPQRNLTVSMSLKVDGGSMTTRGCVIGGLICKSVSWSKID